MRFLRILGWHITPLAALAIQYGHLRTSLSASNASRSRNSIHGLLDIKTARATADTLVSIAAGR